MDIKMSLIPGGQKGKVGSIKVEKGQNVNVGDVILNVETGKGNRVIKSEQTGIVTTILVKVGDEVSSHQLLATIEETFTANDEDNKTLNKSTTMERDLLIIGAGPGGYVAALYAAKKGLKVTLIEKDRLGGTCLNVGCIPTKTLVRSAEIAESIQHAQKFGINISGNVAIDMAKIIDRKNEVVNQLVNGITGLMDKNNIEVIFGQAHFSSNTLVIVDTATERLEIQAKKIIIATGSKISSVPIPGLDLPCVLNSTTALAYKALPQSMTIIGGGVIGMEFAFIYAQLGVKVHVVEFLDRLLPMIDQDMSLVIKDIAIEKGIQVHTSARVTSIVAEENGLAIVNFTKNDISHALVSEKVLVAIGRQPNIDNLGLENTTIALDDRKRVILVDKMLKTTVDNIYAIGDVNNIIQLAHVASHQALTAVDNLLGANKEMDHTFVPNVIFTAPEIASVGIGEDQAKKDDRHIKVSHFNFVGNGKALALGETRGYIKLIKDIDKNQLIGAGIIGPDASTLIATLTVALQNHLTEEDLIKTIFAHPTTAEVIHEAALGLTDIGCLHE